MHWNFYDCQIDGQQASITLDMDLVEAAPLAEMPWLLTVDIALREPTAAGLATREENEQLGVLEDALVEDLELLARARLVGRLTWQGRRIFYFYAPEEHGLVDAAYGALAPTPDYAAGMECEAEHDADWENYLEVLYPDPLAETLIHNRHLVMTLYEAGDRLAIPRPLEHVVRFAEEADRRRFEEDCAAEGFEVVRRVAEGGDEDFPLELEVRREDRVELDHIDEVVRQLWELAERCGGYYLSWRAKRVRLPEAEQAGDQARSRR